jgi:hypothetical protein
MDEGEVMGVGTRARLMVVTVGAALTVAGPALAQEGVVPVTDILEAGAEYEDEIVTVEGELIGDYAFRRDGTMWTQLNDDSYAREPLVDGGPQTGGNVGIGVRMAHADGEGLDPPGGYRLRGPLVRLTGVWKHHDPDRGGESYLDVTSVVVVEGGRRLEEGPDWVVFILGSVLTLVAAGLWITRPREE